MRMRRLIVLLLFFSCALSMQAQEAPKNFGLKFSQAKETLPVSRAPFGAPVRTVSLDEGPELVSAGNREYLLRGGWRMLDVNGVEAALESPLMAGIDTKKWYVATVPGTVLTTLVDNGVFADPYWGLNNMSIPDTLCNSNWWYRVEFEIPREVRGKGAELVLEGINYMADVWLNGTLLGKMKGAFARGIFDVSEILKQDGQNVLAVKIHPPLNPGKAQEQSVLAGMGKNGGQMCLDGPTFFASEGWDWIPTIRDRNMGIWQDVKLRFTDGLRLGDHRIVTDLPLPDTTSAAVTFSTSLLNTTEKTLDAEVEFSFEGVKVVSKRTIKPRSRELVEFTPAEYADLHVDHPRLWWPNGYGEPHLYHGIVRVLIDGKESDRKEFNFGIREYDYDLTVYHDHKFVDITFNPIEAYRTGKPVFDNYNKVLIDTAQKLYVPLLPTDISHPGVKVHRNSASPFLVLRVNGVKVFIKGGNWGMDDAMKRISRERMDPYIRFHREQHFNMIRNWTGSSTSEVLYELCDKYGIMVFNDFSLSTADFNLSPNDHELMLRNVEEIVCRFRNHPSIAIWCARNEGFAPETLERGFADITTRCDGTRYYTGNSIRINLTNSGPWGPRAPIENFKPQISRGFDTELGTISVPTAETMRKMMSEADLWPMGDVWSYHDWHVGSWLYFDKAVEYMDRTYGKSDGIDAFCRKSQLFNYDAYRSMFEAFNSRMWNNTTGMLLWMSHPSWPSVTWQTYTWDYETPAAYFGSKKACEPLHVQMRLDDYRVQVVNVRDVDMGIMKVVCEVYDQSGKRVMIQKSDVEVRPCQTSEVFRVDQSKPNVPDLCLVRLKLLDGKGRSVSENDYWIVKNGASYAMFDRMGQANVKPEKVSKLANGHYRISVVNRGPVPALSVKLNVRDSKTGQAVLPAYFSDGYFTLLPGERKDVDLDFTEKDMPYAITVEGYNSDRAAMDL